MLKTTTLAMALTTAFALTASAGGMSEPVMEADIVVTQTQTSSSAGSAVPLIAFALLVAIASSN